jgi:hypothetical protein
MSINPGKNVPINAKIVPGGLLDLAMSYQGDSGTGCDAVWGNARISTG